MEQNNKLIEENTKMKSKEEVDSKTIIALKKECAEVNGQMGSRIDQIRNLLARNEKLVEQAKKNKLNQEKHHKEDEHKLKEIIEE